ncbi:AbfB domain-containing protein [Eleftheria terrae]|uniref:AbfB domain-containing protein n=1 Tax=Eleftheria terrae TaxID=1597781 RepID=UPI00263AEA36|nr:AbfB domain-containing protein [Eleftheria terrae]WKB55443.1 AbfB domain-containing protein [Eleftheria terrae]
MQREAAQAAAAPVARLTTPWTDAALRAAVPLPEYPRPQMTRSQWLNLNGRWSYHGGAAAPDADNTPEAAPAFPAQPEQVLVPFPVESYLSGIQRMNERNLWYRRAFQVPPAWSGKRILLNFGAVDRKATVYVNGRKVGQHVGGYDAFSFDITPYLRRGNNDLVVGVFDPTTGDDMVGKQTLNPGGIFYTPSSGIWQTVWLEPVEAPHITRLDLTPDLANSQLRLRVVGEGLAGHTVEAVAFSGGTRVSSASVRGGVEFSLPIPNATLWSPEQPFLYDLQVTLRRGGAVVDRVGSYFGMRSIEVGTVGGVPRPLLNGRHVFQYGPLDQGFWPDGLYTAPTDEALKSDLLLAKELGFNMVRKHIKVEPQRWFYWADKLGLLVWQDMPQAWDAESQPAARARFEAAAREIVDEHRSSPAVVSWVIFNESWGDFDMVRMAQQFRSWDPSRLINTHSGINFAPGDQGVGDLIDLHDYPGPSAPAWQPGRIAVLGEFGGNGLRTEGHMWNPASTCCYTLYPDASSLTRAYLDQVDTLRELAASRGLSAAVYTETSDVEDELNGFVTYDRKVRKMDFAAVKAAHEALLQGVPYLRLGSSYSLRTVTPGVGNRYLRQAAGLGYTELVDASSAESLKKDASWKVVAGLADHRCLSLESIHQPGQYLRHAGARLRIDPSDGSEAFRQDATFCPRPALDGGGGVSLESKNQPGHFIRHLYSEVWLHPLEDHALFRADASWAPGPGWWRSSVMLPLGQLQSLRVLTPNFDNRYLRHLDGLAHTEVVTADSDALLKQDASWRIVAGLADPSCYSFESRNFPGEYLRHMHSRVRRDPLQHTAQYRDDATFCAHATGNGAAGVRLAAYNFPNRWLRHYAAAVYISDGLGGEPWNGAGGHEADTRWAVEAAWAP